MAAWRRRKIALAINPVCACPVCRHRSRASANLPASMSKSHAVFQFGDIGTVMATAQLGAAVLTAFMPPIHDVIQITQPGLRAAAE